ncbi:MAG: proprotein convertase P-domain-containing protein [Saprospiraceae bacterium]|nr:proprotein convertase P-domain-containing protein [Saprospiraceae bacterium]
MLRRLHLFSLLAIVLIVESISAQTFTWNTGATIPDNTCSSTNEFSLLVNGVSSQIMSTSYGLEKICVDIEHTYTGDLSITIISPKGVEIDLVVERGDGEDFINTCFDGFGSEGSIAQNNSPFTGTFLPEQPLGLFNQNQVGIDSANGIWVLRVCDLAEEDLGMINSFSLYFGNSPAPPPPSNDNCDSPLAIPVSSNTNCMGTISGSLIGATASSQELYCQNTGNFNDDVWFSFVANSVGHDIVISNVSGSSLSLDFQIGEGTCNNFNPLYCYFDPSAAASSTISLDGFIPGNTYLLRVASLELETQNTTFDLCIRKKTIVAGDACSSAQQIQVNNNTSCTLSTSGSIQNATPSIPLSTCSFFNNPNFDNDVWFYFDATKTSHLIQFSNISGTSTDLIYELLEGSCDNLANTYCQDEPNDAFVVKNLTIGNRYFIRVASYNDAPQNITFDVCVSDPPMAPVNDECSDAIWIPISPPSCDYKVTGSLEGATMSPQAESCNFGSPFQNDVWFYFVATETSHQIEVSNFQNPSAFMLYQTSSGECESLTQKQCFGFLQSGPFNATNLTIGTKYYFRVASLQYNYTPTSFDVCVKGTLQNPPINDECASAVLIPVVHDTNCLSVINGSLVGATASIQEHCVGGDFDDDIWYRFIADEPSHVLSLSNITGNTKDLEIQILQGSDCGNMSEQFCLQTIGESDFSSELNDLTLGTYFVRIASIPVGLQNTTFDLCLHDTIPDPPANDECAAAIVLVPQQAQMCTAPVSGALLGATESGNAPGCGVANTFDDDVWYRFTATEVSHVVDLSSIAGDTKDLDIQVLSGANCTGFTSLYCENTAGASSYSFEVHGLMQGANYYVRIATRPTGLQNTTFDLCIHDTIPDPPANDECAAATALEVTDYNQCVTVSGTLLGATASGQNNPCAAEGDFDDDVWYSFQAEASAQTIELKNISIADADITLSVLTGDCNAFTGVLCDRNNQTGTSKTFSASGLTVGSTYYIRIASFAPGWQLVDFEICVHDAVPDPPINDQCSTPENLLASADETCNSVFGIMSGATASTISTGCQTGAEVDVWYQFTAQALSQKIEIASVASGSLLAVQIFSGACNDLAQIACQTITGTSASFMVDGLTIGQIYRIRIIHGSGTPTFSICVTGVPATGCPLLVTTTAASGPGSLREMLACAQSGDTIKFAASVFNSVIGLALPTIDIDQALTLHTDFANDITLSNSDENNTGVLLNIQNVLTLSGLKVDGLNAESMLLKLDGGDLQLFNCDVEKVTIDRN